MHGLRANYGHPGPSRDLVLMEVAELFSHRSTCLTPNGAVIARDGRIISTGYNGSPSGHPHCVDVGCMDDPAIASGCVRTIHAEANSLIFAAKYGVSTQGATLYATTSPCYTCAKLIINSGITKVVYKREYRDKRGIELLRSSGVEVSMITM